MDFKTAHIFNVTPEQYMDIYFNPDFEQYIVAHSSLKKREVLSQQQHGDELSRDMEICSGLELPAILKKTVGMKDLCYVEKARINLKTFVTSWTIEPSYFKGKIDAQGTTRIKPLEENKCSREISGSIRVKVPFVGSVAESFIIESIKKTYQETARLFEQFRLEKMA